MAWKRFRKKKDLPSGLWVKCPSCRATLFKKELIRNGNVCGQCEHHFPLTARERVEMLADGNSFQEQSPDLYPIDRLDFVDREPYAHKLARAVEKTGQNEAAVYGPCTMEGKPVILCVMDFTFIGGSMGCVVGEKVTRAVELATEKNWPVIVVSASGGARMHEGALSLMQMAKTSCAISRHDERGGLFISVLSNPTTGGVMASFAALGDLIVAEPGALIGFAGPRVIKETLRQQLPDGFQRSEFLLPHGFLDQIIHRKDLRRSLVDFLDHLWTYADGEVRPDWQEPSFPPQEEDGESVDETAAAKEDEEGASSPEGEETAKTP